MKPWQQYQADAAAYFRSLGLDASTDVSVRGVRTSHDVDVLVKSHHVGFDITWVVECRHWQSPVNKLHVLALREIVSDVGADRGILLCEVGFQSGAMEAANLTNVQLTSISKMRETASESIYAMRFRELADRAGVCEERYWNIPKDERIKCGLRPGFYEHKYSGAQILVLCNDLLMRAFRGTYPFQIETLPSITYGKDNCFASPKDVADSVDQMITELETKLEKCDHQFPKPQNSASADSRE